MLFSQRQALLWCNLFLYLDTWPAQIFIAGLDKYEISLYARHSGFLQGFAFLRYSHLAAFCQVSDIVVVDRPKYKWRFHLIYSLLSTIWALRLRYCLLTDELKTVPTITSQVAGANWQEREAWDMFGVFFEGHRDLRRILTDYGFQGHPLRKDYPVSGFFEQFYSDRQKSLATRKVSFAQEWRNFTSQNPWGYYVTIPVTE